MDGIDDFGSRINTLPAVYEPQQTTVKPDTTVMIQTFDEVSRALQELPKTNDLITKEEIYEVVKKVLEETLPTTMGGNGSSGVISKYEEQFWKTRTEQVQKQIERSDKADAEARKKKAEAEEKERERQAQAAAQNMMSTASLYATNPMAVMDKFLTEKFLPGIIKSLSGGDEKEEDSPSKSTEKQTKEIEQTINETHVEQINAIYEVKSLLENQNVLLQVMNDNILELRNDINYGFSVVRDALYNIFGGMGGFSGGGGMLALPGSTASTGGSRVASLFGDKADAEDADIVDIDEENDAVVAAEAEQAVADLATDAEETSLGQLILEANQGGKDPSEEDKKEEDEKGFFGLMADMGPALKFILGWLGAGLLFRFLAKLIDGWNKIMDFFKDPFGIIYRAIKAVFFGTSESRNSDQNTMAVSNEEKKAAYDFMDRVENSRKLYETGEMSYEQLQHDMDLYKEAFNNKGSIGKLRKAAKDRGDEEAVKFFDSIERDFNELAGLRSYEKMAYNNESYYDDEGNLKRDLIKSDVTDEQFSRAKQMYRAANILQDTLDWSSMLDNDSPYSDDDLRWLEEKELLTKDRRGNIVVDTNKMNRMLQSAKLNENGMLSVDASGKTADVDRLRKLAEILNKSTDNMEDERWFSGTGAGEMLQKGTQFVNIITNESSKGADDASSG